MLQDELLQAKILSVEARLRQQLRKFCAEFSSRISAQKNGVKVSQSDWAVQVKKAKKHPQAEP
ncbi:MAG: hypothetical protein MR879_06970 [Campylobacter sp.]|nr:hypothetical protein [Campylobacter sp.]